MVICFGYKLSPNMIGIQEGYNKNFHITLLQDGPNATLRSETLRETVCDAMIANSGVGKLSKKVQNVCDDKCIKHGLEFSCVCDAGHTVQLNELFVMRRHKRNGQPDEGVCDI